MLRREARRPEQALFNAVGQELGRPCHPSALALADAIRARHGEAVAAVLFYGSCLRQAPGDEPPEGIQDFYVIVDRYRDAYDGWWPAFANRLLPPNVFYIEQAWQGRTVRAKYAVVSSSHFLKGTSPAAFHPSLWARFSQPVALLHARDGKLRAEITAAIARAVRTMLTSAAPLVASPAGPGSLWQEALRQTYRAELRPESAERAATIYAADRERYDRMAHLVFADAVDCDGTITLCSTMADRRHARRRWLARRLLGKPLSVLRLMKSLFTFDGGVDYALWKVERHTGVRVPISSFERRHPVLTSPRLLWRVFRLSAVR
ncbi:MAG: hypothetical protein ACR2P3_00045 [Geminicoccaceae bacterium]